MTQAELEQVLAFFVWWKLSWLFEPGELKIWLDSVTHPSQNQVSLTMETTVFLDVNYCLPIFQSSQQLLENWSVLPVLTKKPFVALQTVLQCMILSMLWNEFPKYRKIIIYGYHNWLMKGRRVQWAPQIWVQEKLLQGGTWSTIKIRPHNPLFGYIICNKVSQPSPPMEQDVHIRS